MALKAAAASVNFLLFNRALAETSGSAAALLAAGSAGGVDFELSAVTVVWAKAATERTRTNKKRVNMDRIYTRNAGFGTGQRAGRRMKDLVDIS